ncbi:MAG: NHL domain-containing protein, partial [Mucilaginibacter sp.]
MKSFKITPLFLAAVMTFSSCSKTSVKPKSQGTLTVSTLAGSTTAGHQDGTGGAAGFYNASGLALASDGSLFVGDFANSLVRKINVSTGAVTTVTGTGAAGFADGTLTSAIFNGTANIVFDKSGNLYVADEENNRIREITTGGNVVTVAGSGAQGATDGIGTAATFNRPEGMVIDASGNMYVADNNNTIRKINLSTKQVTTYAGTGVRGFHDGPVASAQFSSPYGLAMDANGDIYVGDIVNNRIRKITVSTGTVSTFAGSGVQGLTNGAALSATFYFPCGLAFDSSGNLFVAELKNNTIRKITTGGTVTTYAGTGAAGSANGPATTASFSQPIGIVVDGSGNVFVA